MKKTGLILILLIMVLSLYACVDKKDYPNLDTNKYPTINNSVQQNNKTNEEKGVPQKQIEAEIYPNSTKETFIVTSCIHNVDTELHQDEVVIEYCANYKYMRTEYVQSYIYQYDRATDIWTQISKGNRNFNYTLLENLVNTEWTGESKTLWGNSVCYDITVDAINTIDGWIKFSYVIDFADKNYIGTEYMEYGEFVLPRVENMFRITFDPDDGFSVLRD